MYVPDLEVFVFPIVIERGKSPSTGLLYASKESLDIDGKKHIMKF